MAAIYGVNIKEQVTQEQVDKFLTIISREKRERIERFHFREDYLRSLYGDIIVRKEIEKLTGMKGEEVQFAANEYGKPHVIGVPDFHYNISHSGDWVVCVTSKYKCGIDVEKISEAHVDIAKRFFTERENEILASKDKESKKEYFFDLWTLKESYIKWRGEGLHIPLDSFSFEKRNGFFTLNPPCEDKVTLRQYNIAEGYKLAVCAEEDICGIQYVSMMQS